MNLYYPLYRNLKFCYDFALPKEKGTGTVL